MIHRIYLGIILCGVLGGAGWFAYNYYVDTQTRIGVLTANNAKLETAQKQTEVAFDTYRANVEAEIEEFKAELLKQQELNTQLNDNLQQTREANKAIAKLLADTDIIKNSLADPKASEDAINEQIDFMFGAIGCATGTDCVRENP